MASLIERHADKILGILSCFDRVVIQGSLPGLNFADGMSSYLRAHNIRIFDYPRFAEPLRDLIRENAERLAVENGVEIQFLRTDRARKEDLVRKILDRRGEQPGLVCILSAMEACPSYKPWHDKTTHKTFLRPDSGKCLHYYFYFVDERYGLCYLRVPTWCPFRLQFYFNGHNRLATALRKARVQYELIDNAFVSVADFDKAQGLADSLDVRELHRVLDQYARRFCPVARRLGIDGYHWSLMQVEYATDIVFRSRADLAPIYEAISRTAIHAVKAEHVATFLGRKLRNYQGEIGNDFNIRIEGTRIRHQMGSAFLKMYDKFGRVLRIETTANDVSFFQHHRNVVHADGSTEFKLADLKKTIYSLGDLRRLLAAANRRYLDFISEFDDPSAGPKILDKISAPATDGSRSYKGFNFFSSADHRLLLALARGEHCITGFRHADLKRRLPVQGPHQISRHIKRLRVHGLIKRVGHRYKYYLTELGRRVVVTGLKLKHLFVLPQLAVSG